MGFGNRNKMLIEVDVTEMTDAQIRLIKTVNAMLECVLTTDDETEFFEGSAEAMRMCAALIKQAHFSNDLQFNGIPYADQAIEYSMDLLNEHIVNSKVVHYDN